MSQAPFRQQRFQTALTRIQQGLNDALNRPKEGEVALTAAQLSAGAQALAARRPELAEATQAAAQLTVPDAAPRREVYTVADAQTFLADTQRMAETLWGQSTGRQLSAADRDAISAYLVDNLLAEERGAPANGREEIAQQAVETQGAAVREFPERALFGQRLRASADAQLQSGLIDQETFNAIIFPATPFADVPAEFRASVPASGAATRQAELKALGVVNHFQSNIPEILRRSVDEPNVRDFREAVGNLVSAQTDEDIVEGSNLFSAPESASQIRARERAEGAAELFTKGGKLGQAVEDVLRRSGRSADPSLLIDDDEKEAATRTKRLFTEGLQQRRSELLDESRDITDEDLAGQLADFANNFVESGQFDQLQTAVSEAFQAQRVSTKTGSEDEIKAIFDRLGLDSDEILPEQLTQLAEIGRQAGGFNEQDVQNFATAFPMFRQARIESEQATEAERVRDPGVAQSLRNRALFNLGERPQSFSQQRLDEMDQFIASQGGIEGFEQVFGPNIERLKQENVLGGLFPEGRPARQFGPDSFPTFTELDALQSQGLGVAPAGNIARLRPGQTQTPNVVRRRLAAQLGINGVNVPVQRPEAPVGFGEITPLLREASGDNLAFLKFLFQPEQLQGLQSGFGEARRAQTRQGRARLQTTGRGVSRERAGVRRSLATTRRSLQQLGPDDALDELGIRRQETLRGQEQRLLGEERSLTGRIGTVSTFQRETTRPTLTLPQFVESRIGGLRGQFAASPAGLAEEQRAGQESLRLESEAERARRRRLRSGGRTIFGRI